MRTFADMTPEERAQCRGMWCETAMSKALFIYVASDQDNEEKAVVVNPKSQFRTVTPLRALTPRADLPRAWMPDGQPPAGKWENDYTDSDGITLTTGEDLNVGPHQEVRRFVTEWEEITNG